MATAAASATSWASSKCARAAAKISSETTAGNSVAASASAKAARSLAENMSLLRQSATAPIFSAELPAALLPAALASIHKGQVTSWATRRQTSEINSPGSTPLSAGAAASARLAASTGGQ